MELEHKGSDSDEFELINGPNSPNASKRLITTTDNNPSEPEQPNTTDPSQLNRENPLQDSTELQEGEQHQGQEAAEGYQSSLNFPNKQGGNIRSENRIEEEEPEQELNNNGVKSSNMVVEEQEEANNNQEENIQVPTSQMEEEKEKPKPTFSTTISADDRPLKGKGSYDFNSLEAMETTPNRRNTTIGVLDERAEKGEKGAAPELRARATSTITPQSKAKLPSEDRPLPNKQAQVERPLTGRGSYSTTLEDERPIGGKGAGTYDLSSTTGLEGGDFSGKRSQDSKRSLGKRGVAATNPNFQEEEEEETIPVLSKGDSSMLIEKSLLDERPIGGSNKRLSISDDRPLKSGRGGNYDMLIEGSEAIEEIPDSQETTGPLSSRVKSKVWKIRQSAFEELIKLFSEAKPKDPIFQEYSGGDLTKFIADANPGAQEKAIEAFRVYLEKQGAASLDVRAATKTLIDKAIGPGKPSIRKISNEVLCLMFEKGSDPHAINDGVIESINNKNQKTAIAGVSALKELLVNYGPKKLEYLKPFFPHLEKLAASTVSILRTEAIGLYKEAYHFMGEALLRPFLSKLKKAQVDELEKYFSENPNKQLSKPLKGGDDINNSTSNSSSLSTNQTSNKGGNNNVNDNSGSVEQAEFDPYDIIDPVDIFKRFNEDWTEKVLEQTKWSDKKAMLEELLKEASSTVKIANTNYQHIIAMLKRTLNDNNINVIVASIKIYAAMAKGLRKNFTFSCKITMSAILAKLKDKRAQIIGETCKALDSFLYCITPEDVLEDLKEALSDKAPEMKTNTISWIERAVEKNKNTPEKMSGQFKGLLPIVKKLLDDSSGDVREGAMKLLAKWKVVLGDQVIRDNYNDIPQPKQTRINELVNDMGGAVTGRGTARTNNSSSNFSSSTPNRGNNKTGNNILNESMEEEKVNISTSNKPPSKPGLQQRPVTAAARVGSKSGQSQSQSVKRGATKPNQIVQAKTEDDNTGSTNVTAEEAESKLIELGVPESTLKEMDNNAWKEKLKGLTELNQWISANMEQVSPYVDHICRLLKTKLKDWKESNLNILKETFSLLTSLIQNKDATLTKRAFSLLAPLITGNIHDTKYSDPCQAIVYAFIEAINPKSVFSSLISSINSNPKPNPKALVELSNLFAKLVEELTLKYVPLQELIDYGKSVIANVNPSVRGGATTLFKAIYQQMGPPLTDLINDINPQTLKALSAEFEKIVPVKELECRINFREDADSDIREMAASNPLDSLPRVDISKDVEKLYKKLTDNDWKVRKEGLDALESILTGAKNRILPNGLYDLVGILKTRLNENNKSQAKSFICFVGKFATALGPGAKVHAKTLIPELIKNLSDKQAAIRQEALGSLQKFTNEVGSVVIINTMLPTLVLESPEIRTEILNWILKNADSLPKAEIKQNIAHLLGTLQDKNKDIRNLAEKVLEKCINVTGSAPFLSVLKDLKPAIQKALKPIIEKYKGENEMEIEAPAALLNTTNIMDQQQGSGQAQNKGLNKTNSDPTIKTKLPLQKTNNYSNFKPNLPQSSTPTSQQTAQKLLNNNNKIATPTRKGTAPSAITHNSSFYQASSALNTSLPLNNSFQNPSHVPINSNVFNLLGQKPKREEFEWSIEELQDEAVELLKDHLKMNVSPHLYIKMFSVDVRKHLDAINILKKSLTAEFQGTIDTLDLIGKWFFLRLWHNSNPEIIRESLDYFSSLILSLETAQYTLQDFEASVLIACLVQKLGTLQRNFQATLHKVFSRLTSVYPPHKISIFLLHGMNSQNPQTRIECMEVLAKLVQTTGPDTLAHKDVRVFGRLLQHNDLNIRKKSMNVILEIGKHMGEDVLALIEKEAPGEAVEELRIAIQEAQSEGDQGNREDTQMQEEFEEQQPLYDPTSPHKLPGLNLKFSKSMPPPESEAIIQPREVEATSDSARSLQEDNINKNQQVNTTQQQSSTKKVDAEQFDKSISMLVNGSVTNKLDALLLIHDVATSEDEETKQFFKEKVDDLILALKSVLAEVFEKPRKEIPAKFLIYFLNMTHKLCSIRIFLKNITEENLREFSEEVLNRLLSEDEGKEGKASNEDKQLDKAENESLVKTLNSTMLRILENSEPNDMFCVLFDLLIKNRRRINNYSKILGLIIKCILKLTKALEQLVNVIQPEKILLKSHMYLLEFSQDPSKVSEDIGIKTIKTILNELVKLYRENIWEFYAQSVQTHPRQDNYIHRWITVILRPIVGNSNISPRFANQPSPRGKGGVAPQEEIPAIRETIEGLKRSDNFEEGLKQLYETLAQYPDHSIAPYLKDCSKSFAEHVTHALERIRLQKNGGGSHQLGHSHSEGEARLHMRAVGLQHRVNTTSGGQDSSRDYSNLPQNLEDLHHKGMNYKSRYGLVSRANNENQSVNLPTSQNQGNNGGYGNSRGVLNSNNINQMNNNQESGEEGSESGMVQAGQMGTGQSKATESLLQKLSEMKLKVASFVKAPNQP